MRSVLICFCLFITLISNGQITGTRISDLPNYTGPLPGTYIPVSVGAVTYHIDASLLKGTSIDTANKWVNYFFKKANTDSIFYVKGSTVVFAYVDGGQAGATIVFFGKNNSDDSTILILSDGTRRAAADNSSYSNAPLTFDESDFTSPVTYDGLIARYVKINENKYALKSDLSTDSSGITYFVDTISNIPKCNDVNGSSYLVGTNPPANYNCGSGNVANPFYNQKNNIVTLIGGFYSPQIPIEGQHLIVTNSKTSGEYKYSDSIWTLFPRALLNNGNSEGGVVRMGNRKKRNVYIIINGLNLVEVNAIDSSFSVYQLANKTGKPMHVITDAKGKFMLVADTALQALYPIYLDSAGRIGFAKTFIDSLAALSNTGSHGITKLGTSPFGLIKVNDSTYRVDSINVLTRLMGDNLYQPKGNYLTPGNNLSDIANAATARNNILPSQTGNNTKVLQTDGTNVSWQTAAGGVSAGDTSALGVHTPPYNNGLYLQRTLNLSDLNSPSSARTNLGLGSFAVLNNPASTNQDLLIYNGSNFSRVPIGSNGSLLGVVGGNLAYTTIGITDTLSHVITAVTNGAAVPKITLQDTTPATSTTPLQNSPTLSFVNRYFNALNRIAFANIYLTNLSGNGDLVFEVNGNRVAAFSNSGNASFQNVVSASSGNFYTLNSTYAISANSYCSTCALSLQDAQTFIGSTDRQSLTISSATNNNTMTAGKFKNVIIQQKYNQITSSASNYDLYINRVETSIGSGTQRLISLNISDVEKFGVDNKGNLLIYRPLLTNGSTPSYTLGTGAGTSATASINGNDIAGYITVNTGTSPTAAGDIITITFATALTNTPKFIDVRGCNDNAADMGKYYPDQATASTTSFKIKNSSAGALAASSTYIFYYNIIQ